MSVFSERLKELRGSESQTSFAAAIGINRVQYAKYESGTNSPSVDALIRICSVVHPVSADWLLGLKDRGSSTVIGNNNAVGANARVTVRGAPSSPGLPAVALAKAGEMPACSKCPHLKKLKKLEALLSK